MANQKFVGAVASQWYRWGYTCERCGQEVEKRGALTTQVGSMHKSTTWASTTAAGAEAMKEQARLQLAGPMAQMEANLQAGRFEIPKGEDGDLYYAVKLKATKLALEYTDKCFVTPVFNGSASLRNAAGQLIEEVAKATRRHKTVDDAFIENLYGEMTSLYRLDGIGGGQSGKAELGELPPTAVMLLAVIGAAWVFIGAYVLIGYIKKRKNQNFSFPESIS